MSRSLLWGAANDGVPYWVVQLGANYGAILDRIVRDSYSREVTLLWLTDLHGEPRSVRVPDTILDGHDDDVMALLEMQLMFITGRSHVDP